MGPTRRLPIHERAYGTRLTKDPLSPTVGIAGDLLVRTIIYYIIDLTIL
jgi:hypothetical protein